MRLCVTLLTGICLLNLTACTSVTHERAASSPAAKSSGLAGALARAEAASANGLQTPGDKLAYEEAVAQVVADWQTVEGQPSRMQPLVVQSGTQTYQVSATWPKDMLFDELVPVVPLKKRKLDPALRDGIGTPFVARWKYTDERKKAEPFLSESGYMVPATVTLDFRDRGHGRRDVILRVHDPRFEETAVIGGHKHPLAANFSALSEMILSRSKKEKSAGMSGLGGLRHSEKYLDKLGLFSLEPPSRTRIPVICVHGLMSRPLTWLHAFNQLAAEPAIGRNYQIYFFRYPSGVPVVYSSAKFRVELAELHEELTRIGNHTAAHHMVLIGHSMGGLVSKLQLTSTGDRLWVNIFGARSTELGLSKEELDSIRPYLEFSPNPHVDRVIFVCTPHRGSKMAEGIVGAVGRKLIHLPGRVLGNTFDILQGEAPRNSFVKELLEKGVPSSIDNLSPNSRFVKESNELPFKPGLHVHSIIGNKDGRLLTDLKCSDGVVPYKSAHLDGVESELVVHSNHGAHERPEAIAEIRRILLLHLKTVSHR